MLAPRLGLVRRVAWLRSGRFRIPIGGGFLRAGTYPTGSSSLDSCRPTLSVHLFITEVVANFNKKTRPACAARNWGLTLRAPLGKGARLNLTSLLAAWLAP